MTDFSNEQARRRREVWEYVGVPRHLAHASLDNYVAGCPEQQKALAVCRKYVSRGLENIARGRGLLFKGPVGTGKSHLSVATVRALIEAQPEKFGKYVGIAPQYGEKDLPGCHCSMIPVFELLERLRESHRSRGRTRDFAELIRRCKTDELIILDDIGAETPTDWVQEQLCGLIDRRYRAQLTTFFTTNCSMLQLEEQIGERVVSRMTEMCIGVRVGGADWRTTHGAVV